MNRVVVAVLGRPWWLAPTLYALRERAMHPVHITCVVDGDQTPWHYVSENTAIARRMADRCLVAGGHVGNGPAFALGVWDGAVDGPILKCDADVIPSKHYDFGLLSAVRGYDNGKLLALAALQMFEDRSNVGIRVPSANRRFTINLAVFTPRAIRLLGDNAVAVPINDHERSILSRAKDAGLWVGITERAWVDTHLGLWDGKDDSYRRWKNRYLRR